MNPKKKMLNCFHYINRKAREYLEQEMKANDEKPMGGGFGGDLFPDSPEMDCLPEGSSSNLEGVRQCQTK